MRLKEKIKSYFHKKNIYLYVIQYQNLENLRIKWHLFQVVQVE